MISSLFCILSLGFVFLIPGITNCKRTHVSPRGISCTHSSCLEKQTPFCCSRDSYWLASSGWKKELLYEWSTLFPMCESIVLLEVLHVSTQAVSRTLTFYHKGTFHSRGSSLHKSSTTSGGSRNSSNLSVAVIGSTWVQPSIMHSKSDQSLESTRRAAINQRLSWIRGYAAPLSAPNVRLKKQFGQRLFSFMKHWRRILSYCFFVCV